ncbi:MAG: HAMP domain-containing sensor histidine kinase [Hyphomicrobiaceae bacterium]
MHWAGAGESGSGWGWDLGRDWGWENGRQAPGQLLALSASAGLAAGLTLTAAWHAVADAGPLLAVLLAALLAACAAAVRVASRPRETVPIPQQDESTREAPCRLLAQMHHELRTPLNAVIGFSEAMLSELHGPLGNARYQQYAAHITESGGRLLKASEDTLAVAATMSTLLADRRALRRDRAPVAALLQEAWDALGAPGRGVRLSVADCAAVEIDCDRQATGQALRHLLAEALARSAPDMAIVARAAHAGTTCRVEIVGGPSRVPEAAPAAGDGLRLILTRSLLEMQGATLSLGAGDRRPEVWSASIAFPLPANRRAGAAVPRVPHGTAWRGAAARSGYVPMEHRRTPRTPPPCWRSDPLA